MQCFNYFSFCTPLIMEQWSGLGCIVGANGPPYLKLICLLESKGPDKLRAKGLSPFIY
jgi:hypothetical protein